MDDEGENVEPMTLETTITDLIEQNTKLGCERAAAVNHFTSILALAPVVYRWKKKLPWYVSFSAVARENMAKIDGYIGRVQQSLMLTPEILENHGYNVEEGNHEEIKKRNKSFSALREFMTTLTETQAGGGQTGTQVAASGWKKVLRFGDGVWPPEPPRGQVPEWVTISDPTVPMPRVNRFVPKQPPGPPPGYKAPPQPYPTPPPKARPTSPTAPPRSSAAGSQSSSSAGPPPQAAPKPAAKSMPTRRDMPETEYVPSLKPLNAVAYSRILMDYTGTPVRSALNAHEGTGNELALSDQWRTVLNPRGDSISGEWPHTLAYALDSQMLGRLQTNPTPSVTSNG